jgi:hypothetical protein
MSEEMRASPEPPRKRRWAAPTLKHVGHVGDVLQGGGGKLSPSSNDPWEPRKPPGGGA